ncbi:uncharacterized protein LOC111640678 [Centruroides sculpturatus]|uniref:uncharacterized protein LOC111640678 n=1 Tax=Centruroides sculpturatus TaxID=218467 RepID=UPI000C6D868B|nr:uncharacterized protein LOC111640678 [Centruroides sculpturatus]
MARQNHNKISFLQYNAGRSIAATSILNSIMHNYDFITLQEPYCIKNKPACLPTNCTPLRGTTDYPWAVSIVANHNLSLLHHGILSTQYICCTEIVVNNHRYIVINYYSPKDLDIDILLNNIQCIMNTFNDVYFIVTGDTNAHSPAWGGERLDRRGRLLKDVFARNGLHILNNPHSPPTFTSSQGHSWIDVTACSASCYPSITNWKVLDDSIDDHAIISFEIGTTSPINNHPHSKYNLNLANWTDLHSFLDYNLSDCDHDDPNIVRIALSTILTS